MRGNWKWSPQQHTATSQPVATPLVPFSPFSTNPEAVAEVLDLSLTCGEMSEEERNAYDHQRLTTNVGVAFALDDT